jgi:hypothetical protein
VRADRAALLERRAFVARFGPLFALGTVFIALGAIFFTFAEEPPVEVSRKELHLAAHLKESARVAWRDRGVPRALRHARGARGRGDGVPFFVLYAVRTLGLDAAAVGGFLMAKIVGNVGANPLWQRVAIPLGQPRAHERRRAARAGRAGVRLLAGALPPAGPVAERGARARPSRSSARR